MPFVNAKIVARGIGLQSRTCEASFFTARASRSLTVVSRSARENIKTSTATPVDPETLVWSPRTSILRTGINNGAFLGSVELIFCSIGVVEVSGKVEEEGDEGVDGTCNN